MSIDTKNTTTRLTVFVPESWHFGPNGVSDEKKNHQKYMAQHITNLITIKDNLILHMFDGYMVL